MRNKLFIEKAELIARARDIRRNSDTLSGDALTEAQAEHKWCMGRISQINESIRNS
jgi:5'-deoxynucleotidase YfbR-like HD superfamily hydrolase